MRPAGIHFQIEMRTAASAQSKSANATGLSSSAINHMTES